MPKTFMTGGLPAADLVATVIDNKYKMAIPLDRQRRTFRELGLEVAEPTLCYWVAKAANCVELVYDRFLKLLRGQQYLHGDETPIQVLREPGKTPTSKSYLWEMRSIEAAEQSLVFFHYATSRSEKVAQSLYAGYQGTLVCDGYNHLPPEVIRAGCWAHVRRKFYEATNGIKSQMSLGRQFVKLINRLFAIERHTNGISECERLDVRQRKAVPIVEQIFQLVEQTQVIAKSKLGRAIQYLLNQKQALMVYLTDPQVAISNNVAERSIRPTVMGRKNWLFSTSQKGAKINAIFLSLMESAEANGLNYRKYLMTLLEEMPQLSSSEIDTKLEDHLPWNQRIQRICVD